mmetsp:Transcript_54796/g.168892  ORF Transcript_54796/g.168892 Transcript_54796/m.168892 type:complete len:394 (-) Transcript_54796:334-1515(-)
MGPSSWFSTRSHSASSVGMFCRMTVVPLLQYWHPAAQLPVDWYAEAAGAAGGRGSAYCGATWYGSWCRTADGAGAPPSIARALGAEPIAASESERVGMRWPRSTAEPRAGCFVAWLRPSPHWQYGPWSQVGASSDGIGRCSGGGGIVRSLTRYVAAVGTSSERRAGRRRSDERFAWLLRSAGDVTVSTDRAAICGTRQPWSQRTASRAPAAVAKVTVALWLSAEISAPVTVPYASSTAARCGTVQRASTGDTVTGNPGPAALPTVTVGTGAAATAEADATAFVGGRPATGGASGCERSGTLESAGRRWATCTTSFLLSHCAAWRAAMAAFASSRDAMRTKPYPLDFCTGAASVPRAAARGASVQMWRMILAERTRPCCAKRCSSCASSTVSGR